MLTEFEPPKARKVKKPPWNTSGRYVAPPDVVNHVRTVIRSAKIRQQMLQDGKEPSFMRDKANEMKFWKAVFDRYDSDNSGALDFQEITEVVRNDLKIGERTLTKLELRDLYSHLDENDDQVVDWHEWLTFVSQGKLRDTRPIDQVMGEVGRAVRTSLRRLGLKPQQVEDHLRALPEAGQAIDLPVFMHIFRRGMRIDRHDCPDDNLKRTFASIADGATHVRLQDVIDFLTLSCLAKTNKEIGMGTTFPGLIGGMQGHLPARMPCSRPGTFPLGGTVSGPTWGCFALNGRRLPPSSRLAVGMQPAQRQREALRPSISCPDLPNNGKDGNLSEKTLALMEAALEAPERPASRSDRGKFASGSRADEVKEKEKEKDRPTSGGSKSSKGKSFEQAMDAALAAKDKAMADPFAIFLKVQSESQKPEPPRKRGMNKKPIREPLRESYSVILGKDALNRVEQQLYEAGVDMRGAYHHTGI